MIKTQNVDTELLDKYIAGSGLRTGYICENLGITRQAFDKKRKGIISFRASEVYVICDLCSIPTDDRKKIFCLES